MLKDLVDPFLPFFQDHGNRGIRLQRLPDHLVDDFSYLRPLGYARQASRLFMQFTQLMIKRNQLIYFRILPGGKAAAYASLEGEQLVVLFGQGEADKIKGHILVAASAADHVKP